MFNQFAVALVLVAAVCGIACGAHAEDELLDIVVTTTLKTTPEHQAAYAQELAAQAAAPLGDLNPRTYEADEKPEAGAAKYRLLVEHDGAITLGGSLTATHGHPVADMQATANGIRVTKDVAHWESHWYLKVQERGKINYTIQEWTGDAYRKVSAWSANMPASAMLESMGGRALAASVVQSTDGKYDRSPPCPVTIAQAKEAVMEKMLPSFQMMDDAIARDFLAGIVQVQLLTVVHAPDAAPQDGDAAGLDLGAVLGTGARGKFQIVNRSPWPIKSVAVTGYVSMKPVAARPGVGQPGLEGAHKVPHAFAATHAFDKPLEGGKSATIEVTGSLVRPLLPDARRLPPTRVGEITFSLKP